MEGFYSRKFFILGKFKGVFCQIFLWKTRSDARGNWSLGAHKALFHLDKLSFGSDVVPTVMSVANIASLAVARETCDPSMTSYSAHHS